MLADGSGSFFSSWTARPIGGTLLRQPTHGGEAGAVTCWTLRVGDDADTLVYTSIDRVRAA